MLKITFLFSLFLLISCGTETGNPIVGVPSNSNGNDTDAGITTGTGELLSIICDKLVNCNSSVLNNTDCIAGIKLQSNFDTEFGLSDGVYADLQAIIDAEANKLITPNATELNQCKADITALICSDNEVINAFDGNSPTNFSDAFNIIPTGAGSCNDLFD